MIAPKSSWKDLEVRYWKKVKDTDSFWVWLVVADSPWKMLKVTGSSWKVLEVGEGH